jgi:hypothetical protein
MPMCGCVYLFIYFIYSIYHVSWTSLATDCRRHTQTRRRIHLLIGIGDAVDSDALHHPTAISTDIQLTALAFGH